jgi:hypothetical protein
MITTRPRALRVCVSRRMAEHMHTFGAASEEWARPEAYIGE